MAAWLNGSTLVTSWVTISGQYVTSHPGQLIQAVQLINQYRKCLRCANNNSTYNTEQ